MRLDHTVTLVIPIESIEIAKRISRALDPDVGGYDAFQQISDNKLWAKYTTPCTAAFASQAAFLLACPEKLYNIVVEDYKTRWLDLIPPSLEEVTVFVESVLCYVDVIPDLTDIATFTTSMPILIDQDVPIEE